MEPVVIVASLLMSRGSTGVETHSNQLHASAREAGFGVRLVSVQHSKNLRRKAAGMEPPLATTSQRRCVYCGKPHDANDCPSRMCSVPTNAAWLRRSVGCRSSSLTMQDATSCT